MVVARTSRSSPLIWICMTLRQSSGTCGLLAATPELKGRSDSGRNATFASRMPDSLVLYVLNGPNLNLLGMREPDKYGTATLDDVEALCAEIAEGLGLAIDFRQTNG